MADKPASPAVCDPVEDREAAAWELTGALGLTVRVRGSDLVIDPDEVDEWWPKHRATVLAAYRARRQEPA